MRIPEGEISVTKLAKAEVAPGKKLEQQIAELITQHPGSAPEQHTAEYGQGESEKCGERKKRRTVSHLDGTRRIQPDYGCRLRNVQRRLWPRRPAANFFAQAFQLSAC